MQKHIEVQSVVDIITNSSSEIFCTIHSSNKEFIEDLYDMLNDVYGWNQESELTPVIEYGLDDSFKPWTYDSYEDEQRAREEAVDKSTITIEMPYCMRKVLPYHRAGIEKLVSIEKDKHLPEDTVIEFNEDF